jgi:Aromatic-ring-opening dioxygenase LigAB, LigA subunit
MRPGTGAEHVGLCGELSLSRFLRHHAFRAAMQANRAGAIAKYELTDEEREALLAGDVAKLYRLGVNGSSWGTCRGSRCVA